MNCDGLERVSFDKKPFLDNHNFLVDGEITVTITLDEYRDLVSDRTDNLYTARELREQVSRLEASLKTIRKDYDNMAVLASEYLKELTDYRQKYGELNG